MLSTAEPEPAQDTLGVVLLEQDNTIASANAAAEAWLDELDEAASGRPAPGIVAALASRAREVAAGETVAEARVRFRTPSGRWLSIHASILGEGPGPRCVVILEPAGTVEIAPLIADAYALTERERAITQLVAQGSPRTRSANDSTCRRGPFRTTSSRSSRRPAWGPEASSSRGSSSSTTPRASPTTPFERRPWTW